MGQPVQRVSRLLEAAGRRRGSDQIQEIGAVEFGTFRAIVRAFGEYPPPLPDVDELEGEREPDKRQGFVMKIMRANEPKGDAGA